MIGASLNTTVVNNPLFPEPSGPNVTTDVFNVTAGVTTDIEFRCLDQATAFSGVTHNLFKSVWFYEFNRSYQTTGYSPNVSAASDDCRSLLATLIPVRNRPVPDM